jgi:DNA-binding CsgD family transcriptional regulator
MASGVIGRDDEIERINAFVDTNCSDGLRALVLAGDAGIGKSMLWGAGVEAARERGLRVLISRPAETESGLTYVGLDDLFKDVLAEVLPALPPPRRRALEVALLLEDDDAEVEPRTLAVAVRSALEELAARDPIVVAIDDIQWFDPASANALAFALRRLGDAHLLVFLARRVGEVTERPRLEETIEPGRVGQLLIGPLSVGATHEVLRAQLGRTFARPTLLRVHETAGGNPFYALELARALGAEIDPSQPLRVPETLEGLVRARLDCLSPAARAVLLLVATIGRPSQKMLAELDITSAEIEPAFAARVIERENGTVRFTHPLLASVLYQSMPEGSRQHAHRSAAAVVEDPLDRARHLALATDTADAEIARTLEEAAVVAVARGALVAAAELSEHVLRLTPDDAHEERRRRAIVAARAYFAAGETLRARALAQDLVTRASPGRERAEATLLLTEVSDSERGVELLRTALHEADDDLALQALIHQRLGWSLIFTKGLADAERHAYASLELAQRLDDDALRAGALAAIASVRHRAGDPESLRMAEEAYALAAAAGDAQQQLRTGLHLSSTLLWSARLDRARAVIETLFKEWSERNEGASESFLWQLSLVEFFAGRLSLAAEYAAQWQELCVQYATDDRDLASWSWVIALIAAHRGDLEQAREIATRGRSLDYDLVMMGAHQGVSGVVALWSGDARAAVAHFSAADHTRNTIGNREPTNFWWRGEEVEALLELGRPDEAIALLTSWEAAAERLDRPWVLASARRCRGLVASARGEVEQAETLFVDAASMNEAIGNQYGRAQTLLALGVVRRRARQKRAAREAIESALSDFEEVGARGWADKARGELGRIGGHTRTEGLTPAERRVATLVAAGKTNREVAATLFLGERTVASHLTRIYSKLGVRSRTELARKLQ